MTARAVRRVKLAGLSAYEVPADAPELTAALLHGYGADGSDLVPLAAELPCRRPIRWLFLEAPETLASFPGSAGRAWFPIDEEKLLEAQQTGVARDFGPEDPPGLAASANKVAAALEQAGAAPERTVLGGFSQGAMVAAETGLSGRRAPAGLAILSGNLIARERWLALAPRRAGVPFFQSHGRMDPILGFRGALALETLLREAGLKGSLMPFDGGHGIPPEVLEPLASFLDSA